MPTKYAHTNIISANWEKLAQFYIDVFGCQPVPPARDQSGEWLSRGTGVKGAALQGMHLRLPGYGEEGPTLEIYQYAEMKEQPEPAANRKGFGHIAFQVENVAAVLEKVVAHGGRPIGEVVTKEVEGVGIITFTYVADPEGNLIELQRWEK
ncbi:MAG: VOC family protein [Lewinellaceae bacterium]|nr:VOC family protein [Phaeodactylibacter sp.]MCB9039485.1 VOC family protein [Lewinellaceae bacterium]